MRTDTATVLDFAIAGCAKSGTTAIAELLDAHPSIYMSDVKETNYFVHGFEPVEAVRTANGGLAITFGNPADHVDTPERFAGQFAGAAPGQRLGEASPLYLTNAAVPGRLLEHNPDVRVVLVLRNPSDVAYSNFVHHVRDEAEAIPADDVEGFADESRYADPGLHVFARHLDLPRYATQLPAWTGRIAPERLHIEIFEEFRAAPEAAIDRIVAFLGLEPLVREDERAAVGAVNQSRLPRFHLVHRFVLDDGLVKRVLRAIVPVKRRRRLRLALERLNAGRRPSLPEPVRARLDARFAPDRAHVASVLGRPVPAWDALQAGSAGADGRPSR